MTDIGVAFASDTGVGITQETVLCLIIKQSRSRCMHAESRSSLILLHLIMFMSTTSGHLFRPVRLAPRMHNTDPG